MTRITALLLTALIATLTVARASAAEDEGPRWYRVELLIFHNLDEQNYLTEDWDPLPDLEYPQQYRFLVDPETLARHLADYDSGAGPAEELQWHQVDYTVNDRGVQVLRLLPPELPPFTGIEVSRQDSSLATAQEPQPATASEDEKPLSPAPDSASLPAAEETTRTETGDPVLFTPTPFVTLPEAARQLSGDAAAVERSGRYRVLFHEAWVQPFRDEDASVPLVLDDSGDTGDWPRLQGSITLYLSRYLHLKTDLWLNTDGSYLDRPWRMPPAPQGPPRLIVDRSALSALLAPVRPDALIPGREPPLPLRPDGITASDSKADESGYRWQHAVRLVQQRRMRSGELHYVDHPMLGLLIRIDPVTPEELDELAHERLLPGESLPGTEVSSEAGGGARSDP